MLHFVMFERFMVNAVDYKDEYEYEYWMHTEMQRINNYIFKVY